MAQGPDTPAEGGDKKLDELKAEANKKVDKEEELSEEDAKLKESLEGMVTRTLEGQTAAVTAKAVEDIGNEIRTATTSMTSVPKPLKFLLPHYDTLKEAHSTVPKACQAPLADVISVLGTVAGKEDDRDCLKYRLLGTGVDPGSWGHEYMRHVAGEIAAEYAQRSTDGKSTDELMSLVKVIVPHHMEHNAEPEAVDLLLEVEDMDQLLQHVNEGNYARTCLYLTSAAAYLAEPDDSAVLHVAFDAYMKVLKWHDALRVALRLNSMDRVHKAFNTCEDPLDKQQLAYLLARHNVVLDCEDGPCAIADEDLREKVVEIMSNTKMSEKFLALARDLDVMEPKLPEDVYKMHLVEVRGGAVAAASIDSAMKNLSSTLVNALLNVGFGVDKLVMHKPEGSEKPWIFRNKDQGKICATASIGAINMWDVDGGMPQLDKYTYSEDPHVVAGACLGFGLCCCCVRSELDPAYALLYEHVASDKPWIRVGAVMGLGLAYAGTGKEEVQSLLEPLITDGDTPIDLAAHAALSLGAVFAGTTEQEAVEGILQALMTMPESKLDDPFTSYLVLGLGQLFLGTQETVEPTLEVCRSLNERISKYAVVTLTACAYAGTGNVLKIQEMMTLCGEHETDEAPENAWKTQHLGPACIGIGLIAMGEDLGASMAARVLEHLLQYGDPKVRQGVPLALALLHVSSPDMYTMDTLSRLSHDQDGAVAKAAVLALGFLGAGTNNARLAGMLRSLSAYYQKDPPSLHLVRVAQGMLHLGKGLVTISPYHSDRQLLSNVALSGILSVLWCGLDTAGTLAGKHAFMLYYLAPAMRPRFLLTVDEAGDPLPVAVRVGLAVDTVAQAGQPKSITGFQTHNTPVLLAVKDRAELATEKYLAVSPLLEGVVIVKKNPKHIEGDP